MMQKDIGFVLLWGIMSAKNLEKTKGGLIFLTNEK